MSTKYIEGQYYDEFKKLIETVCPYKLEIFKYNGLQFHKKWVYCNKFSRREKFKDFMKYCILNKESYTLDIYRGLANISQYINIYEGDDFEDYKNRSILFNVSLYEVDNTFINIIKEATKILEQKTHMNNYDKIVNIIIYFFSSILTFKAEHGEYIDVTKPIQNEDELNELDNFIRLNAEELYIHIKYIKC